jgi:hypothetical protein
MHPLSDFSKFIGAGLSQVPRAMVNRQVLEAAIEFCEKTWALKTVVSAAFEPTDIDDELNDSIDIDLTPAGDTVEPLALVSLVVNGASKEVERLSLPEHYSDFPKVAATGRVYYDFPTTRTVRVWPMSFSSDVVIAAQVAFRPKETATELDDKLYDEWRRGVLDGARADLYDQPDANWYSERAARMFRRKFLGATAEAKRVPPESRVQFPSF